MYTKRTQKFCLLTDLKLIESRECSPKQYISNDDFVNTGKCKFVKLFQKSTGSSKGGGRGGGKMMG